MGKSSRDKGRRVEYQLRDELRRFGFKADRVPCSGAAQGAKGDVTAVYKDTPYLVEVKVRAAAFSKIYDMFYHFRKQTQDERIDVIIDGALVTLSSTPLDMTELAVTYTFTHYLPEHEQFKRAFSQLLKLREFVKTCDFLAFRDDRKPFLYARFR